GERGVEVEVRLDAKGDKVLVDRIQVQQVLLNLIRNAIEAMADSPTRRLRISSHAAPEGQITVVIEDSGPGRPQEVSERLFEAFVSTKSSGMGLGLSIC